MQEENKVDVGDTDEQATEIDLDAPAPEQSLEEEIQVEQISENDSQSADASEKPSEQPDVPASEKKAELDEYSEGVKKRIAKLTRKMREAERQKEEAIKYAQQLKEQADKVRGQYDTLGNNYTKELEAKVQTGMDAAQLAYKQAVESQNVDAQIEAQKAQIDPKAEDWASKNPWFGTDNAMTYTAFDIHRKLVEEEGFDPQSDEYYSEVDKRIKLEFPHKFDNVEQPTKEQPVQNVASAKRPAGKGRKKTVRLTPSQVAISKRLGVPLEEYAKHLAAKEG